MQVSLVENIILLAALFYTLSAAADIVVVRMRRIGERLGISLAVLGVLLGLLTSLPEMAIAVNAAASDAVAISFGNLMGGVAVIIGLILGTSVLFNRGIETADVGRFAPFLYVMFVLPLALAVDGELAIVDGFAIIAAYLCSLALMFRANGQRAPSVALVSRNGIARDALQGIAAAIGVIVLSNLVVRFTLVLLETVPIAQFVIGSTVFAIGTNLPEILVAARAWQRGIPDLSLNHLLASAAVNILIVGVGASIRPLAIALDLRFVVFAALFAVLAAIAALFTRTGRRLTMNEGAMLLAVYLLLVMGQFAL